MSPVAWADGGVARAGGSLVDSDVAWYVLEFFLGWRALDGGCFFRRGLCPRPCAPQAIEFD